jgi:hypothetical protein
MKAPVEPPFATPLEPLAPPLLVPEPVAALPPVFPPVKPNMRCPEPRPHDAAATTIADTYASKAQKYRIRGG